MVIAPLFCARSALMNLGIVPGARSLPSCCPNCLVDWGRRLDELQRGSKGQKQRMVYDLGGLVCKAHRLLYHSTLGLRVVKKKKGGKEGTTPECWRG